MRVLLVSWEFPPVVVGGLGRHVGHLAEELAAAGHEVVVLSRGDGVAPRDEIGADGVRVIRAETDPPLFEFGTDMLEWVLALGHSLVRSGLVGLGGWVPDVIHAHDWLVAHASTTLSEVLAAPLVSTIHATEAGRHSGWVSGRLNRQVHSCEWWLANASDGIIVCSESMRDEVTRLFADPTTGSPGLAPITRIHNGIDTTSWPFAGAAARRDRAAVDATGARLLFLGRLEYEKGVQDAIAALPRLRRSHPGTRLTVAGSGTQLDFLRAEARRRRVVGAVDFVGALDHPGLVAALHAHDVALLPSRYEPFGIVALEAAACGTPLVTSTAGGLGEAVVDGVTGRSFAPADIAGLAAAVRSTLDAPAEAAAMAARARERLGTEFSWAAVAAHTAVAYREATERARSVGRRAGIGLPTPTIPARPLPDRDPTNP